MISVYGVCVRFAKSHKIFSRMFSRMFFRIAPAPPLSSGADTRVVVLGGGAAGFSVIHGLSGKVSSLTLVDPLDRAFHNIGAPRAMVEATEDKLFIPFAKATAGGRATHVRGAASSVDTVGRTVTVRLTGSEAEQVLPYDVLVIATGTSSSAPSKALSVHSGDAMAALRAMREALADAKRVVIVGGGPVGVEVAGELASADAAKAAGSKREVHLFHRGAALLSAADGGNLPDAFREKVRLALQAAGVAVHLGAAVPKPDLAALPAGVTAIAGGALLVGPMAIPLPDGGSITADATLFATGSGSPNNAAFRTGVLASALDANGRLKVTPSLQVLGCAGVFALGDIAGTTDSKIAYIAGKVHAPIVVRNIITLAKAERAAAARAAKGLLPTPPKLAEHHPSPKGSMLVTLGRSGGVGTLNGSGIPTFLIKALKGKDLFVGQVTKERGYAKPGVFPDAPPPAVGSAAGAASASAVAVAAPAGGAGGSAPVAPSAVAATVVAAPAALAL